MSRKLIIAAHKVRRFETHPDRHEEKDLEMWHRKFLDVDEGAHRLLFEDPLRVDGDRWNARHCAGDAHAACDHEASRGIAPCGECQSSSGTEVLVEIVA